MPDRRRALFAAVCLACALAPFLYVLHKRSRFTSSAAVPASPAVPEARGEPPGAPGDLEAGLGSTGSPAPSATARGSRDVRIAEAPSRRPPRFLYRNTEVGPDYGALTLATGSGPIERHRTLPCERVHYAGGTGICLTANRRVLTTYAALVFDDRFDIRHRIDLAGGGSRARVAPNGRLAAVTVFVSGHSYADATFSTATTLIDTRSGATLANLEEFVTLRDGVAWREPDFNFWGVTFAGDSNTFFATLSTGGRTYLVRGDAGGRRMVVVREGVECPSLSPDGSRIAFKKLVDRPYRHWELAVLDLSTLQETPLTERRNVDDQVEWLDDESIVYGLPESETVSSAVVNTWVIDRRGIGEPRLLLRDAESTVPVR